MKKEELLKVLYRSDGHRINNSNEEKLKKGYLHQWVMGGHTTYGMI